MINFSNFYSLLNEGGAGGHMPHPFDLPNINTGKDLTRVFENTITHIKDKSAATKIDGVNVSVRLVDGPNGKEFALDRGSMKDLDLEGITIDRLEEKWPNKIDVASGEVKEEKHGMVKAGQILLGILNDAIPHIEPELKALRMWNVVPATESRFINTEFVEAGGTNVINYGKNFIAFHGINKFKHVTGKNPKTGRQINRREGREMADSVGNPKYNINAFDRLVNKVHAVSKSKDFDTHCVIPVRFNAEPDLQGMLNSKVTICHSENNEDTRSLDLWLSQARNPLGKKVELLDGSKVLVMQKKIYQYVIGEDNRSVGPLDEFIKDTNVNNKLAIDAAIFWHATRVLGREILSSLETQHGDVIPVGEGIVIRGMRPTPRASTVYPVFKIAGDFIVGGLQSSFK